MTSAEPAGTFWQFAAWDAREAGGRSFAVVALQNEWVAIARILAILSPKGDPAARLSVRRTIRLGEALCDGGDAGWTGPRPVVSEMRLAQLLATRGVRRTEAVERAARTLAQTLAPDTQIDAVDLAAAVLLPDRASTTRRVAESYYRRLDRATAALAQEPE
jgi:hypothetical protein